MWPVVFTWRGHVLHSYPVVIYAALLLTLFLTVAFARSAGLDPDRTALAILLSYVPAFVCARLLYAARHWDHFGRDPWLILKRAEGGLSLSGGIVGMVAGLVPLLLIFELPAAPFFDALALGSLAGITVAKGGCVLNGCCHGHETAHWCGIRMPDEKGIWRRRFPAPFIEMAWAAGVLVAALAWRFAEPKAGLVACGVLALHSAGRIGLQTLRDESAAENLSVIKTSALLIAAALLAGYFMGL